MAKNRTNTLAGTIRKGSVKHIIYEAVMTNPIDRFTTREIWNDIKNDNPTIKLQHVQDIIGSGLVKLKIVKKTDMTRLAKDTGRKIILFERDLTAKQPIIKEPGQSVPKGKTEPQKRKRKYTRKPKAPELPDQISALELGESIIDYIKDLQERFSTLALNSNSTIQNAKTQEQALQKQIRTLTYENDGLKKNNADLTTKLSQNHKSRTFNTQDVLDFKKRQAEGTMNGRR